MDQPKKYPYLDHDTLVLPGELWKDIHEYEEYYEVSNLGRVKSLDRIIPHPRLRKQKIKGRFLRQKRVLHANKTCDPIIDLQVALSKKGKTHYYNVRRLVYGAFIAPIDFQSDALYVINIDGDGYNNRCENLRLISISQNTHRSIKRGRVPTSYLKTADRSKWNGKVYGGASRRKPVRLIKRGNLQSLTFVSIAEASRQTGIGEKEIINVAKGRYSTWKGDRWEYIDP